MWTISLSGCDTGKVPALVLESLRSHLVEMGHGLGQIPQASPFWSSINESGLAIIMGGWKFRFHAGLDHVDLIEIEPARVG
jgi:hypothetical protein